MLWSRQRVAQLALVSGVSTSLPMSDPPLMPAVLVVEDEALVRTTLAEVLQEEGFRVIQACNAAEAILVLEAHPDISVVLADVEMPPGAPGHHLATEASRRWPHVRFVITSGRTWPDPQDMPESAVFMPKPWTSELLVEFVWEAADRSQLVRRR
jgi:DNA-binding NtrC family response regulator